MVEKRAILSACGVVGAFVLLLMTVSFSAAMEPPGAGEVEHLKRTGDFPGRLANARGVGNHRIDRYRVDRALTRARRELLSQRGLAPLAVDRADPLPAPPPAWRGMPTTGAPKIFALLVDFSDYPHANPPGNINSSLFGNGSLIPGNAAPYESLTAYYKRASYNLLDFAGGVTLGWYRPAYTRASMAQTATARESLIKEALSSYDAAVDFSQFDNNGDGAVDYFVVIWAGPDNGWANFWWGYQTSFGDGSYTLDGTSLAKYSWQWEYKSGAAHSGPFSPRVVIHETGHALGLPDYYDYDDTVGPRGGVGGLDMMDGTWGDHNSFSKWVLDWISPTVVSAGSQSLTLNPSGSSAEAVLVTAGATAADPFREFFIAQNRYRTGNDTGYPTNGMLIWHVDARLDPSGQDYLYDNSYTPHKLLKLMQADGLERIENLAVTADAAMYYAAGKTLTAVTTPSSRDYLGVDTRVAVTGIAPSGTQVSATYGIDAVSSLRTLTVTRSGADAGAVTSAPAGIACGADCAESFAPGTTVTLTAKPAPGAVFTGWSGGGCSGRGSCTVTLATDIAVTASFSATMVLDETFTSPFIPPGWTQRDNAAGGNWWFMDAPGFGYTGGSGGYAIGATYAGSSSYDIELRTPALNLAGHACAGVEFKTDLDAATADVDLSLNGAAGPWTNLWRKTSAFRGPATVSIDLMPLASGAGNAMLRFRHHSSAWLWWLVDDVKVMASGVCLPGAPTGVSATAGRTEVTVSFTPPSFTGGSPITGYTVTSTPPGGVDQDAGTTATTHRIVGLTTGTSYTFTVRASNASHTGPASAPSNSVAPGVVFSETFDAFTPPFLPVPWRAVAAGGAGGTWAINAGVHQPFGTPAHSGANVVLFNSYAYSTGSAVALITPPFSLAGVASAKGRFWIYRDAAAPDSPDRVDVFVNTTDSLSGATALGTVIRPTGWPPAEGGPGWYRYDFTIPGTFSGATNYLLIKGVSSWGRSINVDDIQIVDEDDTTAPTVTGAASSTANGYYKAGAAIDVSVSFSEAVSSAGLTISFNSGGSVSTGPLSGVTSYTGVYTVGTGETAESLSVSSIAGTITDVAANATVNPAVPAGQNIADRKGLQIDTTLPTVVLGAPSLTRTRGGPVVYAVTYADAHFVFSTLAVGDVTLNRTGTADGTVTVSGSGANRSVSIGSITGDGTLGISLASGTAKDWANNLAPAAGPSATFLVDRAAPATTATPAGGSYWSAQSVALSCDDGAGGSGCANTYYCTGAGCTPTTAYGGVAIPIAAATSLRFYSRDAVGNNESPTKTEIFDFCTAGVSPASLTLAANAGLGGFGVSTQAGCAWSATTPDAWITLSPGAGGSGSGTVQFSVSTNTTPAARLGSIVVAGSTVEIRQEPRALAASFVGIVGGAPHDNPFGPAPLEVTFDAGGSRGSAPITNFHWDFGDGDATDTAAATVAHSFPATGSFVVTLTITAGSDTATTQRTVTVADEVHLVASAPQLQAALTAAQSNGRHDLIRIAAGSYALTANGGAPFTYLAAVGEDEDLVLEGGWTPDFSERAYNLPSILAGDLPPGSVADGGVLSLDGAASGTTGSFVVDGLTISGGSASGDGGGLHAVGGGSVTLSNSEVSSNSAGASGGGVFLSSPGGVWVTGSRVLANTGAVAGAGVARGLNVRLLANEVRYNAADADGGLQARVWQDGVLVVGNNTIHGNESLAGSAGLAVEATATPGATLLEVHNNIIYGNSGAPDFAVLPGCASLLGGVGLSLLGNDIGSAAACADYPLDPGNVSVEPWFVANDPADIRLRGGDSLLIDAGSDLLLPAQDLEGDAMPLDGGGSALADIGADEYNPTNPSGPTACGFAPATPTIGPVVATTTLTVSCDHPAKRDTVLSVTHVDTNTDSPGQPLVTASPRYLRIPKGAGSAEITVQALGAVSHGTSLITASDPSGVLPAASATVTVAVGPDTAAPTGGVLINAGAVAVNTTAVTLNLAASDGAGSGVASMRFRNSTVEPYTAWEPYQATRPWTLVGAEGTLRVYAQFMDGAGNVSDANPTAAGAQGYVDGIVYDPTPPTGTILINNNAASTGSATVTLNLAATDGAGSGVASMRFRSSMVEPYGAWEAHKATRAWTLSGGFGTKKVYAQFMDKAGNVSDANPAAVGAQAYMDAIEFKEAIAPTGSILIENGAASTATTAVTLHLSATDAGGSGLASMRFRNSTAEPYSAWEPYEATASWTLTGGAGTKKVYAQFMDGAGNLSDANPGTAGAQGYTDSIELNP